MPVPLAFASLVPDLVSIPYSLAFRQERELNEELIELIAIWPTEKE